MKSARFVCVFAILISLLAAQSSLPALINQPGTDSVSNVLPKTDPKAQARILENYGKPQLSFEESGTPRRPLPMQGLSFAPAVAYGSGGYAATSVAVADVNGDGKPDLLMANQCATYGDCVNGSVGVMLGNGDGTFQTAVTYGSGPGSYPTYSVAVADVNGDGKPDLVVANSGGSVGVLLGNGDGTFKTVVEYNSGGPTALSVAVADVNGDGKPDLVVANNDGSVGVLLGNGDGTFQPVVTYGSGGADASSVAVADVNGDGKLDVVVADVCSDNQCDSSGPIAVLLGNGDGTFQAAIPYGSGGYHPYSVAIADVNGDGKADLLVANLCAERGCSGDNGDGIVGVLLGNGDGTFQTALPFDSGGNGAFSVAVADVNDDGHPDLLVANYCCGNNEDGSVAVLLGNGDGTFQPAVTYDSGGYQAHSVAATDVNGDGRPDLLAGC